MQSVRFRIWTRVVVSISCDYTITPRAPPKTSTNSNKRTYEHKKILNPETQPNRPIGLVCRVFLNGPVDWGSTLGRVISKTQKWYLVPSSFTIIIIRYLSRVKWSNPGEGVAPFLTPRCSSYWKGSLRVTLTFDFHNSTIFAFIHNRHKRRIIWFLLT